MVTHFEGHLGLRDVGGDSGGRTLLLCRGMTAMSERRCMNTRWEIPGEAAAIHVFHLHKKLLRKLHTERKNGRKHGYIGRQKFRRENEQR